MSHDQFISAYETLPLGFLISTPKALRILWAQKVRDMRFQSLLFNWAGVLFAMLIGMICGFSFLPLFWAAGVVAEGVFLFLLVLCVDAGNILLNYALEDERFFELATRCHALSICHDTELSTSLAGRSLF
jgi:hypothetical protein